MLEGTKWNASLRIAGNIFSEESAYQQPVLDIQTDNTLDPGASPATGARYIIENSASLHANFGTITGVGDDDIVEYDGTNFVIVWDASVQGEGAIVWDKDSNVQYQFDGTAWQQQSATVTTDSTIDGDGSGGSPLGVADAAITTAKLAADAVDDTKLADNAVGNEHLQDNAVDTTEINALAVTTAKIAADAIDGTKIADDAVDNEHIAAGAVGTTELANLGVTTGKIAADAVDGTKIADNSIGNEHLLDDAVDSAELATDAVGDDALDYAGTNLRSGALTDPFTAALTRTFTHNWSTTDVIVEVFDVTTGETCYVESVVRTANAVAITVNQTPTNSLRIVIREVNASQTTLVAS